MKIESYLEVLPEEVLANGEFCVTRKGDKQPYDPFKKRAVSAKDQFYSIFDLLQVPDLEQYETIGLKVGKGISVIDIDKCIDSNGELSPIASELIHTVKSYTELSPSGKGIRILFKTKTKYDFNLYKTKNSSYDFEYYDADDQETRGGRMCRLSGVRIFGYDYAEADTSSILNKYMLRPQRSGMELSDDPADLEWCKVVKFLLDHRLDFKPLLNRDMDMDESSTDMVICNIISEYTTNINEIKTIFEMTEYYNTKGIRSKRPKHKEKWNSDYGWKTVSLANPSVTLFPIRTRISGDYSIEQKIAVAIKYGITKQSYFKDINVDAIVEAMPFGAVVDILYGFAELNLKRLKLKEYLNDQIRNER